jgi:hypothetical protein
MTYIELAQFAGSLMEGFSYRITDVDDAIMNASGPTAAFAVWRWIEGRRLPAPGASAGAVESAVWRPRP